MRWVMIPGNEPTCDGRFVGITTVTEQQWKALAGVIGRDDMADDPDLGTMIGRFRRAGEVNDALRAWTGAHTADEVVAACVEARVPATIVGNGAELPQFDHVIARDVLVRQPGEAWIRPRGPFRFHGVADRELVAPGEADRRAGVAGACADRNARCHGRTSARGRDGARLHRVLGRAGRDRLALRDGRRRGEGRGGPAPRRHPVQRGGASEPGPEVLRDVRALPRVEPRQAGDHARPRATRRSRPGPAAHRERRCGGRKFHAARARALRPRL